MKTTSHHWKDWWNERAKPGAANIAIDRGGSRLNGRTHGVVVNDELERRSRDQLLSALDLKTTDVVLDAGCGTGANFAAISPNACAIVAVDFSEEQIKRARRRVRSEDFSNVKLHVGSITALPFAADSFDKVICTSVLQYLDDDECEAAFSEMIRVCRNQGVIVIHAKNSTSLYGVALSMLRIIARLLGRKTANDHYRPRLWYGQMLARHGGRITDFDAFGIFYFPPMPGGMVQRLLSLELRLIRTQRLKRFGVNYRMTVRIAKQQQHARVTASV